MEKSKILKIIALLKREYPEAVCALYHNAPHELLIAARLSAQCTDKRVNAVTPALFAEFPTAGAFAEADVSRIEELIRSCGLYKTKAADIKNICAALRDVHITDDMEQLLKLPGVGRKTANLIRGELFNKPAIVADTHVMRLSNRLGLCDSKKDAYKTELALKAIIPEAESLKFCHRLVLHGRKICTAKNPKCEQCSLGLEKLCKGNERQKNERFKLGSGG